MMISEIEKGETNHFFFSASQRRFLRAVSRFITPLVLHSLSITLVRVSQPALTQRTNAKTKKEKRTTKPP